MKTKEMWTCPKILILDIGLSTENGSNTLANDGGDEYAYAGS